MSKMRQNPAGVKVERLMRDLEEAIRTERRARSLAHGGASEYRDPAVFADVEGLFRRVLETRDLDALLLPQLMDDVDSYSLRLRLRHASHRPVIGRLLVYIKRRILLPINRWLYDYMLDNFRRQERVNRLMFACIEELAIENARLRKSVGLTDARGARERTEEPFH